MRSLVACAATLCVAAADALAQDAAQLSVGAGVHYSTGDYGSGTDTGILAIPLTGRYDRGLLTVKVTVPWLEVSGGTAVVPGVGSIANTNPNARGRRGGGATSSEATASGMGDTTVSAAWGLVRDTAAGHGLDVGAKVKIATADADEGLGTGEHDVGLFVDAYKVYGRNTVFGGVGHTWLGSSPYLALEDVWSVNLGVSHRLDERDSAGLSFDGRQRVSASASPQRELTAFYLRKLDRRWTAQAYFLKGFADGSPDWGLGASAMYAF
jgi:hypothetical protein